MITMSSWEKACSWQLFLCDLLTDPVSLAVVVTMQPGLIIAVYKRLLGIFWRLLDGVPLKIDEYFGFIPTDTLDPFRRNQDLFPRQPVSGIDDEIANCPCSVIDDEVFNMTDLAVSSLDTIAL